MQKDVVVIGAGAAGLFCAIHAAIRGRSTVVLEKSSSIGRKIKLSGGGRCNFTNRYVSADNYISQNPHFVKAALARFEPGDFVALLEKHGVAFFEQNAGRLFCRDSSGDILRVLRKECAEAGVQILAGCTINDILKSCRFVVDSNLGRFECRSLVVATGGLSYPQAGASDWGYRLARQFKLRVTPVRPALVPLILSDEARAHFRQLSGISLAAAVRTGNHEFRDNILFTHRGLSGPAMLQISSYWNPGEFIDLDLLPEIPMGQLFRKDRNRSMKLQTLLCRYWPEKFAKFWIERHCESKPLCRYSNGELRSIEELLHCWRIQPAGTEGYERAEVTAGGVDTNELSSQTMEARRAPGLYFIGEVVDVTGQLGGFNLHWAWASGFSAGLAV